MFVCTCRYIILFILMDNYIIIFHIKVAASTYGNYVTTIDGKMNYLEAVKDTVCRYKGEKVYGRFLRVR